MTIRIYIFFNPNRIDMDSPDWLYKVSVEPGQNELREDVVYMY